MNAYKTIFLFNMMEKYADLENLVKIFGPTGYERLIQEYYAGIMKPYVDKVYSDNIGNCYAEISGDKKLPRIMMNAHADSVGFIVKHIDDRGFVFVKDITDFPAIDYRMLPGTSIIIQGRHKDKMVRGHFIPLIPLHLVDDLEEAIDRNHLLIDLGVRGKAFTEEGKKRVEKHISIGDFVVMESNPRYQQLNEDHFISANLDDRVGLYCMYRIAKTINRLESKKRAPIVFVSTVREEDWTGTAATAAQLVSPKYSITFDVTAATDTIRGNNEDFIAQKYGDINLDKGPALPRGTGVNDELFLFMEKLCLGKINPRFKIHHQIEVDDSGIAENHQILPAKLGIKACGVYIPCRNTHTTIETVSLKDTENTIKLGTEFYKQVLLKDFDL